jgi:hypothetical protein
MNGPGDRAPKLRSPQEPSLSTTAKATAPSVEWTWRLCSCRDPRSSARSESHSSGSWEISKVPRHLPGGRQPWERDERCATAVAFEKSDEAIVPRKSAKTLVTLVESMEGRAEAAGKLAVGNAYSTLSETMPPTQYGESVGLRREPREDRCPEVGARCGKSARRVLSGGPPERAVPTGTADECCAMTASLPWEHRSHRGASIAERLKRGLLSIVGAPSGGRRGGSWVLYSGDARTPRWPRPTRPRGALSKPLIARCPARWLVSNKKKTAKMPSGRPKSPMTSWRFLPLAGSNSVARCG